jgi:enamine deaminase RidA (YjgF/YER057c/UK114 family)
LLAAAMPGLAKPRAVGVGPVPGSARAVLVEGAALTHTGQFFGATAREALSKVDRALRAGGSSLGRAVKLNFVLAADDVEVGRVPGSPAVSLVSGSLADSAARVGVDAVGVSNKRRMRSPQVAVLPAGGRTYVSGQSANGSIPEATRATMEKLRQALEFQGLGWQHVTQVKSFLDPIASAEEVRAIIAGYFGPAPPPQVFVEWTSKGKIEIELVAEAPGATAPIEYLTPTGETASPVFSRIARLAHPSTIYVSGLYGSTPSDGAKQIHEILADLKASLADLGGDLLHMAKATYYVADDTASRQLNEIRPAYYDPKRPPAASKAPTRGTGRAGRSVTLDMIAVPRG